MTTPEYKLFVWGVKTTSSRAAEQNDMPIESISIVEYEKSTVYAPSSLDVVVSSNAQRNTRTRGPEPLVSTFAEAWRIIYVFVNQRTPPRVTPLLVTFREVQHQIAILRTELQRASLSIPQWAFVCALEVYEAIPGSLPFTRSARTRRLGISINGNEKARIEAGRITSALHVLATLVEGATRRSFVSVLGRNPCYLNTESIGNIPSDNEIKEKQNVKVNQEVLLKNQVEDKMFITTRTGTRYHLDASCGGLRNATEKFSIRNPEISGLLPCKRCVLQHTLNMGLTNENDGSNMIENHEENQSGREYIVTDPGKFVHTDKDCPKLRLANSLETTQTPSPNLPWCVVCTPPILSSIIKDERRVIDEQKETDQAKVDKQKEYDDQEENGQGNIRKDENTEKKETDERKEFNEQKGSMGQNQNGGPQVQNFGQTAQSFFFIEPKGNVYHADEKCTSLSSTSHLVLVSRATDGMHRCQRCIKDSEDDTSSHAETNDTAVISKASNSRVADAPDMDSPDKNAQAPCVFTTPSGKLYHGSKTCPSLYTSRSIIPTCNPPRYLKGCPRCLPTMKNGIKPLVIDDAQNTIETAVKGCSSTNRTETSPCDDTELFVTQRGTHFHKDEDCRYLQRAKMIRKVAKPADNLDSCTLCASQETSYPLRSHELELSEQHDTDNRLEGKEIDPEKSKLANRCRSPISDDRLETVTTVYHARKSTKTKSPIRTPTRVQMANFGDSDNVSDSDNDGVVHINTDGNSTGTSEKEDREWMAYLLQKYGPFWRTPKGQKVHTHGCPVLQDRQKVPQEKNDDNNLGDPCRYCLGNLIVMWETMGQSETFQTKE